MNEVLCVKVCEITGENIDFNGYLYKLITCAAKTDSPFDVLVPVETQLNVDDVITITKCKLVKLDCEEYVRTAVRVDELQVADGTAEVSKYFNIPFIGKIKKQADAKVQKYGPDATKFIKMPLQMKDSGKGNFIVYLLGFDQKADLLNEFERFDIIYGTATLKHKNGKMTYELAVIDAQKYEE